MKRQRYIAYVGTYTNGDSKGIQVYELDTSRQGFIKLSETPVNNPSALTVAHNGKYLYSIADEGVAAFRIMPDGLLEHINTAPTGGMRGCALCMDANDRYVFVGGYHDGRVSMLRVNKDGSIGDITDGIFHKGLGVSITEKNFQPHVTDVCMTPDDKYLCAVDQGLDQVVIYEVDYEHGKIKKHDIIRLQIDAAPRKMVFGKDGIHAYVLCESKVAINIYKYNTDMDEAELQDSVSTIYQDPDRCAPYGLDITEDGKYLFVSNAGTNTAAIFKVKKDGDISEICQSKISGEFPKVIKVLPDSDYFVTLNHEQDEIVTFKMNYAKGYFLQKGRPVKVEKPNCIYIHRLQ
ncbi:lactonase family protein [Eubacterium oxidoreducens]|uniref:6-phosphogluconolactonase n=1 Tax=Eubacterium oxidoreducens TaxID=1732 RepID=A0A1G6BG12_EUBOX|nr:beta-propeller fold lactonase family protein [Eubacterium oxidoreducens]SDB19526.1 6-phosphogluconolactonase [Eubacterium oxidoreducens]